MGVKIITIYTPLEYHIGHFSIDLKRKTAVLIRQSMKNSDKDHYEGRLLQEGLIPIAIKARGDEDDQNLLVFDEGAGVSGTKGYDERDKLSELYLAIANDIVGSLFIARPDRLFRDKHFLNVSMFTELAERKKLMLIVPGRRFYDFTKYEDLKAFQKDMQDAYGYLATQVKLMNDARYQKMLRGLWGGGRLPAPYVIDRSAWKEQQKPIIYTPWLEPAVDLFTHFKAYDFSLAQVCRYIECLPYIFPLPEDEDVRRYLFRTGMRRVPGGYTLSDIVTVRYYLSNLTLGGYNKAGKDEEGNTLLIPNAFDAAIPFDLLDAAYGATTGYHIDGAPFEGRTNSRRYMRSNPQGPLCLFTNATLKSTQGNISTDIREARGHYNCFEGSQEDGHVLKYRTGMLNSRVLWAVSASDLDRFVVERLYALARHDSEMAERVKQMFASSQGEHMDEAKLLQQQIEKTQKRINRLDFLLKNPDIPLDEETAKEYAKDLAQLRPRLARLIKKQDAKPEADPEETITNFYFILAHLTTEFEKQSVYVQRQIISRLVKEVTIDNISPHLFRLYIVWQDGVATRPDVALVWRGHAVRDANGWTEEESLIAGEYWPEGQQLEIMRLLPMRSWTSIKQQANQLGVVRSKELRFGRRGKRGVHETMTFQDLEAATEFAENEEDQAYICEVVNTLAEGASRKRMTAYWPLPVDIVGFSSFVTDDGELST